MAKAELGTAAAVSNQGKTESELRTNSGEYNEATRIKQLIHEEVNSAYNHHNIIAAIDEGRAIDMCHEKKVARTPCLILGSGPSLDYAWPRMHEWKGGIVCSPSQARTVIKWGAEPSYILSLDPFDSWAELEGPDWSKTKTKLIVHPGVMPDLIANWPNEILLYRENLGRSGYFYQEEQKRMYTRRVGVDGKRNYEFQYLITSEITLFACSLPCQAFAANSVGYGSIFMLGADFAYSDNKDRFTDWTLDKKGKWVEHVHPRGEWDVDDAIKFVKTDSGLDSHITQLYYKKNMMTALRLSWQNAVWLGQGAVTEYPTTTVDAMYDSQGKGYKRLTRTEIRKITDTYLARVGAYVIEAGPHRMSFIESADPEIEARAYMVKLKRKYGCPNCGTQADAPDDRDHTGTQCRSCGKPDALVNLSTDLDIEANMRRIRKLVAGQAQIKNDDPDILPSVMDIPGMTSL